MLSIEDILNKIAPYLGHRGMVDLVYPAKGDLLHRRDIPQRAYWRMLQNALDVHAKGKILDKIKETRPNEPEHNAEWRRKVGEPITVGHWARAKSEIGNVLTNSTATLLANEPTTEYVNRPIFGGTDLYSNFTCMYFDKLVDEANSLTIAMPTAYVEMFGVSPVQHAHHEFIAYIDKNIVCWLSPEESEIEQEIKKSCADSYTPEIYRRVKKPIYNVSTKDYFFRLEYIEELKEWAPEFWEINAPCNPAFQNGGTPTDMNFVYCSFFQAAVPFGNLALDGLSDFQSVRAVAAYPHIMVQGEECPGIIHQNRHINCMGGSIVLPPDDDLGGEGETVTCTTCKGEGKFYAISPNKVHVRKPFDQMEGQTPHDPISFAEATPANVKLTFEFLQQDLKDFITALCLYEKKGEGTESARAIGLQMETTLSLMRRVGPVVFGNLEKIISCFQSFLTNSADPAKVLQPIRYGIASEAAASLKISNSFRESMPPYMREQYVTEFLNNFVGGNSRTLKAIKVMEIDPYFYYTLDEKIKMLDKGAMTLEQFNISTQAYSIANTLLRENPIIEIDEAQRIVLSRITTTTIQNE